MLMGSMKSSRNAVATVPNVLLTTMLAVCTMEIPPARQIDAVNANAANLHMRMLPVYHREKITPRMGENEM